MKKRMSLVLALVICLSLCACGDSGPHPLSIDFQTEEELVSALELYFSDENWDGLEKEQWNEKVNEFSNVLSNNTSIHHYFQKSDEAIALAYRLSDDTSSIGQYFTWLVFDSCNTSEWYAGIADNDSIVDRPLFISAWYYDRPTFNSVADAIRDNFKDPFSVSVLSGEWSFIKPVDGYYEGGRLEYVGIVDVRATNSFGGYVTQKYVIKGTIKGEIRLVGEYNGSPDMTGTDQSFYKSYNAVTIPQKMEAENFPMP